MNLLRTMLFVSVLLLGMSGGAHGARAEEALTVSVTPPLFQITIGPGEFWASNLKIVNTYPYDVAYYTTVVNFEASGEGGTGTFVPIIEDFGDPEQHTHSLAYWIDITKEATVVPKGSSVEVPFSVRIPENAEPGGHYAAILVGTQPPQRDPEGGLSVAVSSYVSSLFFARIQGEVIEDGRIREFVPEKTWYEKPEASFTLRFENTGTVHVRPQGDITIYNMWGKERGKVEINQKTNFGNVLPGSTRRFTFSWNSDASVFDLGRYRAEVALTFGDEVKRNVTATTYFYVLPVVPVASSVGGLVLFFGSIFYFVRRYVRRVVALEQARIAHSVGVDIPTVSPAEAPTLTLSAFARPLEEGIIDLRAMAQGGSMPTPRESRAEPTLQTPSHPPVSFVQFAKKYRLFFYFIAVVAVGVSLGALLFGDSFVPSRTYEISNVSIEEEE